MIKQRELGMVFRREDCSGTIGRRARCLQYRHGEAIPVLLREAPLSNSAALAWATEGLFLKCACQKTDGDRAVIVYLASLSQSQWTVGPYLVQRSWRRSQRFAVPS